MSLNNKDHQSNGRDTSKPLGKCIEELPTQCYRLPQQYMPLYSQLSATSRLHKMTRDGQIRVFRFWIYSNRPPITRRIRFQYSKLTLIAVLR